MFVGNPYPTPGKAKRDSTGEILLKSLVFVGDASSTPRLGKDSVWERDAPFRRYCTMLGSWSKPMLQKPTESQTHPSLVPKTPLWGKLGVVIVGMVLLLLMGYKNSLNTTLYHISLVDFDGGTHYRQLLSMYEGATTLNVVKLFGFHLNYGADYFIGTLLLSFPAIASKNWPLLVWVPRMVTAASALAAWAMLYLLARLYHGYSRSLLFSCLVVGMPAFWSFTSLFRPDWTMTALMLVSTYFLAKDNGRFEKNFWLSILMFGVALGTKTQALIYYTTLVLAMLWAWVAVPQTRSLRFLLQTLGIPVITYFALNPHALHPVGFYAVARRFMIEMGFMNGLETRIPLLYRWTEAHHTFMPAPLICACIGLLVLLMKNRHRYPQFRWLLLVQASISIHLFYLLFVSKGFNTNYALSEFVLLFLVLLPFLKSKRALPLLFFVLTLQIGLSFPAILKAFRPNPRLQNAVVLANETFILDTLSRYTLNTNTHVLISPNITFDPSRFGWTLKNLDLLYGPLSEFHIDDTAFQKKWTPATTLNNTVGLKQTPLKEYHLKAFLILDKKDMAPENPVFQDLMTDKFPYTLVAENQRILIFKHASIHNRFSRPKETETRSQRAVSL